jgi:hypothetical protein
MHTCRNTSLSYWWIAQLVSYHDVSGIVSLTDELCEESERSSPLSDIELSGASLPEEPEAVDKSSPLPDIVYQGLTTRICSSKYVITKPRPQQEV